VRSIRKLCRSSCFASIGINHKYGYG